jgi:D-3-phosphoglycerate dehydrogenase
LTKFKVVMTDGDRVPLRPEEQTVLEAAGGEYQGLVLRGEEAIIAACRDADAVINSAQKLTPKVIEAMERCVVIARTGVGVDTVDVPTATRCGITVTNVPDFCFDEVSDTAMSLILATMRKLVYLNNQVKAGNWNRNLARPIHKLRGSTLGLVAFGNIARAVANKAESFGFRIIASDPYVKPELAAEYNVTLVDLDTLLRESDVISIHAPFNSETYHLIGEPELRKMKPSAFLVNTGRGPVVDGKALARALEEGWIAGAGLDVMEKEPPDPDDPLLKLDNVVLTPHYASYTEEAYAEMRRKVVEAVAAALRGEFPRVVVNPEVKPHARLLRLRPAG